MAVTRRLPQAVEDALGSRFEVRRNEDDRPATAQELRNWLATSDGVLCTVTDGLGADVLGVEPLRARILANFGVGFNHIDLTVASERGLTVTNTPDVLTDDTADLAIALMLAVARRMGEGERELRAGAWTGWRPTHLLGTRVSGKTLGVVGLGRIGRAVARRARNGFGMRILAATRSGVSAEVAAELGVEPRELDDLLRQSDFVSLHVPASAATRHLIDARRLALMPEHAVLVNTARGDVVDETALATALGQGRIRGAGLDVYQDEPTVPDQLRGLANVVLLPHLGSATTETRTAMGLRALANLEAFFDGEVPEDVVAGR